MTEEESYKDAYKVLALDHQKLQAKYLELRDKYKQTLRLSMAICCAVTILSTTALIFLLIGA